MNCTSWNVQNRHCGNLIRFRTNLHNSLTPYGNVCLSGTFVTVAWPPLSRLISKHRYTQWRGLFKPVQKYPDKPSRQRRQTPKFYSFLRIHIKITFIPISPWEPPIVSCLLCLANMVALHLDFCKSPEPTSSPCLVQLTENQV